MFLSLHGSEMMPQGEMLYSDLSKIKCLCLHTGCYEGKLDNHTPLPALIDSISICAYKKNVMPSPFNKP